MKDSNEPIGNKRVLAGQIFLLVCYYMFAVGVFAFLGYAVYRSVVENDHPTHAIILASIISFAFVILTSVMSMVFIVIISEGRKKKVEAGGIANES